MSNVAVASLYYDMPVMQNLSDASPQAQRKPPSKARRNNQKPAQSVHEAYSDSNLPASNAPRSQKPQRQKQQGDRAASAPFVADAAHSPRGPPAPMAPLHPSITMTPAKAAYAGPTFHASPAPSSLPVPKFFSKSVPAAAPAAGLQARMDKEESSSEVDRTRLAPQLRENQQSPLDMFFRADRDERAKRQSSGSSSVPLSQDALSPIQQARGAQGLTPSHAGKDMFMMELDDSGSPAARRSTARPAARRQPSEGSTASTSHGQVTNSDEAQRQAYTQSLKDLLKLQPSTSQSPQSSPQQSMTPIADRRSPVPSTPQPNLPFQQSPNLHYGNRNLSPLFQAARTGSPTRPSSNLRHQVDSPNQSPAAYSPLPQHSQYIPSGIAQARLEQQPLYQNSPGPTQWAQAHYSPNHGSHHANIPAPGAGAGAGQQQQQQQQGRGGPPDVKDMEDRLRGILKLGL